MGCRCNERRTAIVDTGKAIAQGDTQAVAEHLKFITVTAAQDLKAAGNVLTERVQNARARLMQRRR